MPEPRPEQEAEPPTERTVWPPVAQPEPEPYVPAPVAPPVEEPVTQRDPYLAPVPPPSYPDPYLPQFSPAPAQFQPVPVPVSPPAPPPPPPPAKQRGHGLWRYAPIPAALVLAVGIVWGAIALRDEPSGENATPSTSDSAPSGALPSGPNPTPLDTGDYTIRLLDSGLCMGEGPEAGNTAKSVLVQADCATATPPMALHELESGAYHLTLKNAELGPGCVTPDGPETEMLYIGQTCDETGGQPQQHFRIEPAEGGYRIQNVASGHCMAPLNGDLTAGVAFIQAQCGGPAQVFTFEAS